MSLGVYGTVVSDFVDFFALSSNFGHGIFFVLLKLLNDTVHDINKDNLVGSVNQRALGSTR